MASWGLNFRGSPGFVTDAANETDVRQEAYPVTRIGLTFGYLDFSQLQIRDRDASIAQLAGCHFSSSLLQFIIEPPSSAGRYAIRLALGDGWASKLCGQIVVKDGTLPVLTYAHVLSLLGWFDAADVDYDAANWLLLNAAVTKLFPSNQINLDLSIFAGSTIGAITHIDITEVPQPSAEAGLHMEDLRLAGWLTQTFPLPPLKATSTLPNIRQRTTRPAIQQRTTIPSAKRGTR